MTKTILITGANGRVGSALVKYIDGIGKPYNLRLGDLEITEERGIKVDVSDFVVSKTFRYFGHVSSPIYSVYPIQG